MHRLPQAKGIPARTGEIQWVDGRADQANQKRLGGGEELVVAFSLAGRLWHGWRPVRLVYLPDRNAEAAHLGTQEPVLGRDARSALFESALVVFGVVEPVYKVIREDTEQDPKTYPEESEAVLPSVEAINGLERKRVSGEESEENGKCERRVETEEENRRLRDQHLERAQQGDGREHFPEGEAGEFCLGWWVDVEAFGAAG
jgi:hypothetical protein